MDLTGLFQALILGIIEGITEFLPISSTGHLIIAEQWLGARSDMFNIVIQAGAILAVTVIYWQRLLGFLTGWRDRETRLYLGKLIVAFLVTSVLGLLAKKLGFKLPETVVPIAWALVIGGFWMILAEHYAAKRPESRHISWTIAVVVGVAQVVAGVFPARRDRLLLFSRPCCSVRETGRRRPSSPSLSAFPPCTRRAPSRSSPH